MGQPKFANPFALAVAAALLGACSQATGLGVNSSAMDAQNQTASQSGGQAAMPERAFNRFPDIPVPTGADMDVERTLVFGSGESWYGQLGIDAKHDSDTMFDFYKQELPGFGWQEITSVRALVSVLTYERQGRILSIQLEKPTWRGSKITLTISPRSANAPAMGQTMQPPMAQPMTQPMTQPMN